MSDLMNRQDEVIDKIRSAFDGPNTEVRTIGGISRHTGLSQDTIEQTLQERPDLFIQSQVSRSAYMLQNDRKGAASKGGVYEIRSPESDSQSKGGSRAYVGKEQRPPQFPVKPS